MIYQYTWVIDSVDLVQKYMVVTYTLDVYVTTLNIPTPMSGADIPTYVRQFAPLMDWLRMSSPVPTDLESLIGTTGTETIEYPPPMDIPHGIKYLAQSEVSI